MNAMLKMSQLIDGLNERVGRSLMWLVLFAVVISAVNAVVRKAFDMSSNAFLEIQWYLFAAVVMLGSAYTMLRQGHVKIDVIVGRFSKRTQLIVECVGIVFLPLPLRLQGQSTGLAAGDPGLPQRRDVAERRRPDPLAGVCPGTHRLHPAGIAGSVGIDQAHRLPARHCRRSNGAGANQDGRGRTGRGNPQASSRPRSGRACRGFPRHACGQENNANGSTK